ncbi:hypothetical protein FB451DRAFT_1175885 [Mycena latifolia]|nr:hypothetical protein FB451DRAFT_1175885 [Mycena latifolia]
MPLRGCGPQTPLGTSIEICGARGSEADTDTSLAPRPARGGHPSIQQGGKLPPPPFANINRTNKEGCVTAYLPDVAPCMVTGGATVSQQTGLGLGRSVVTVSDVRSKSVLNRSEAWLGQERQVGQTAMNSKGKVLMEGIEQLPPLLLRMLREREHEILDAFLAFKILCFPMASRRRIFQPCQERFGIPAFRGRLLPAAFPAIPRFDQQAAVGPQTSRSTIFLTDGMGAGDIEVGVDSVEFGLDAYPTCRGCAAVAV